MDNEEKLGILIAVVVLFGGAVWTWWKNRATKQQVAGALQQPELTAGAADGSLARVGGTVGRDDEPPRRRSRSASA